MSSPNEAQQIANTSADHVSFLVCGTRFDVDKKYRLIKPIGHGAYGVVW